MKNTVFLILKPSNGNLHGTDQGSEDEHLRTTAVSLPPPKSHSLYLTSNSTLTMTTTIHPATNNPTRAIPLGITRRHDLNN